MNGKIKLKFKKKRDENANEMKTRKNIVENSDAMPPHQSTE